LSMSLGAPNAARSTGSTSVSKVTPKARYSSSVNPPTGLDVSATTIALSVIATTRPVRYAGLSQKLAAVELSWIRSPTLGVVVAAARDRAPDLPIIVRAATDAGVKRLASLGAQQVIHPELEGGLQIVRRTLLQLGFPLSKVQEYADVVRGDNYDSGVNTAQERQLLHDLLSASDNIGMAWLRLGTNSSLAGRSLAEANLRARAGASVVAIMRDRELITNPEPGAILRANDLVGLVGDEDQLKAAQKILAMSGDGSR